MAHTFKLTDGTDTVDLIYVGASQEDYRLEEVESRGRGDILPIIQPADASENGPEPIRINRPNREWRCKIQVWSSGRDDQHNNFHSFQRMFSQAGDARTWSPVDKVYLEIQLDSATNWTRYDVKYCYTTDDSGIFGVLSAKSGVTAPVAPIEATIVTKPSGYGATEKLRNYLKTPHFEEDGDADGLADNWTETGTPTTTLDTDVYLCASQSQKVVTDAAGTDGIKADTVTIGAGDYVVARVWIHHDSGDTVTMSLLSGTTIDSTDTDATADAIATGAGGKTWSRYDLAGIGEQATLTMQLKIERLAGDASAATTYYVDKCYMGVEDNLLSNNGFETPGAGDPDFWANWTENAGDGALANEAVNQHWGNDAMKATAGATVDTYVTGDVTVVAGEDYTLRFWTRGDGTYDGRYRILDVTNATNIVALTATGVTGTTYTEVTQAFTAPTQPADCVSVRITLRCPSTAAGIAYFDDVCVHKALTLPTAWSSYWSPTNHNDTDAGHINYIDVEDIPGDQPALTRIETGLGTWTAYDLNWYMGVHNNDPGRPDTYFEDKAGAGAGDRQYSTTGIGTGYTTIASYSFQGRDYARGEYVCLICLNDQAVAENASIRGRVVWGSGGTSYTTEGKEIADHGQWVVESVGPINLMWPKGAEEIPDTGKMVFYIQVQAKHPTETANIWVDFLHIMPVMGGYSISTIDNSDGNSCLLTFDGLRPQEDGQRWYNSQATVINFIGTPQGTYPQFQPNRLNRLYVMARQETAGGDFHSTAFTGNWGDLTIEYKPQTLTLLGTI